MWRKKEVQANIINKVMGKVFCDTLNITHYYQMQAVILNIFRFFEKTAKSRKMKPLTLREAVRSILSSPDVDPKVWKQLLFCFQDVKLGAELSVNVLVPNCVQNEYTLDDFFLRLKLRCFVSSEDAKDSVHK